MKNITTHACGGLITIIEPSQQAAVTIGTLRRGCPFIYDNLLFIRTLNDRDGFMAGYCITNDEIRQFTPMTGVRIAKITITVARPDDQ